MDSTCGKRGFEVFKVLPSQSEGRWRRLFHWEKPAEALDALRFMLKCSSVVRKFPLLQHLHSSLNQEPLFTSLPALLLWLHTFAERTLICSSKLGLIRIMLNEPQCWNLSYLRIRRKSSSYIAQINELSLLPRCISVSITFGSKKPFTSRQRT